MKKSKAVLIAIVIGFLIPIVIASFSYWSLNPLNWGDNTRGVVITFSILISGIAGIVTNHEWDN